MSELDTVRVATDPLVQADEVVLVDESGHDVGTAPRATVHTTRTPLHRAFSIYLFDDRGRTLITRRALSKTAWPGVWSNSCCGHPRPGEPTAAAVQRRVIEELGMQVRDVLVLLPDFRYRAVDSSGVIEHELCPVYLGRVDEEPTPDPDEVMDYAWMRWPDTVEALHRASPLFSPWMALQVPLLSRVLPDRWLGSAGVSAGQEHPGLEETLSTVSGLLDTEGRWARRAWAATGLPPEDDQMLEQDLPTWLATLVAAGGKRIRPRMCHWGYVAADGRRGAPGYAQMCRAAAALELLHVFALIHDDVMDESERRRGRPAVHVQARDRHTRLGGHGGAARFGDNVAILLGDLAHMQADRLVSGLPADLRGAWYELCAELIAGQGADLTGAAGASRSYEQADRIAQLKSGAYTIERPMRLGALAAGADLRCAQALRGYGEQLGRAFALRDDILGVWGDPAVTGKPGGDDLRSRKPTVLWMLAQDRLEGSAQRALHRVGTPQERPDDVPTVQEAMTEAGLRAQAEDRVCELVERALAHLHGERLTPAGIDGLTQMAEKVAWREA